MSPLRHVFPVLLLLLSTRGAAEESRHLVADFESEAAARSVKVTNGTVERLPDGDGGHFLRFRVNACKGKAWITLGNVPKDIRPYRRLRIRLRADRTITDLVTVRLRSSKGAIRENVKGLTVAWRDVDAALPDMFELGEIDPAGVDCMKIVIDDPTGFVLDVDGIELIREPGGWRWSEKEQEGRERAKEERWWKEAGRVDVEKVFGADRVKKVRLTETAHFAIYSDSKASRSKFARALEPIHDDVCTALGIGGMPGKLPVFVFQNKTSYRKYCRRLGWTAEAAEASMGHACPLHMATCYRTPGAETAREMAMAVFSRTFGRGGGDWLHTGAGAYVAERCRKKSAAILFAPRLRAGDFVPLKEFVAANALTDLRDGRGDARVAEHLELQAGALFEYLLTGPPKSTKPGAVRELARMEAKGDARLPHVTRILGQSVDELEKAWIAWGSRPPPFSRR